MDSSPPPPKKKEVWKTRFDVHNVNKSVVKEALKNGAKFG
jgi:hypothetical protein